MFYEDGVWLGYKRRGWGKREGTEAGLGVDG